MFVRKLIPMEHAFRPPRYDLTPPDLQEAGWLIQPYFEEGKWTARHEDEAGGSEYVAPYDDVEQVIEFVRTVKIAKQPWKKPYKAGR